MYKVHELVDIETARKIGEFLTSENAFDQTWAPNEKAIVRKSTIDSIGKANHRYWYVKNKDEIIGAIGVRENKYGSGGFEMDADYIAVHKNHRRKGIASQLLHTMEEFVKQNGGRFIHILSCDIESYMPALAFYKKNGYKQVSHLPNYYVTGEGRIDLYKEL